MSTQPPFSPWQRAVAVLEEEEVVQAVTALFTVAGFGLLTPPATDAPLLERRLFDRKVDALFAVVMPVIERKLRQALVLSHASAAERAAPEGQETAAHP